MQEKEDKPLPRCKAMLLCERTMVEAGSKKLSLIGLVDTVTVPSFPGRSQPMKLFLHLVDGIGDYDIAVQVHDLAEDEIIFSTKVVTISFPERLVARRLIFSIAGLPIPHAGRYDVIVFGNGREVERQQIRATAPNGGDIA